MCGFGDVGLMTILSPKGVLDSVADGRRANQSSLTSPNSKYDISPSLYNVRQTISALQCIFNLPCTALGDY